MSSRTGAALVVAALEQIGVRYTFGIPGVHNTELYDELGRSQIKPILVTSEHCGAFMADAISRTSDTTGCLMLVPAAGVAHAMSGIGEAYLAGIAMLVITGGVRLSSDKRYALHEIDQAAMVAGVTKAAFKITAHDQIASTILEAYRIAVSGVPGPVLVEVPVDVQMDSVEVGEQPRIAPIREVPPLDPADVAQAAATLNNATRPVLYLGWGANVGQALLVELAQRLQTPVTTTLQGLSVFPHDHPLHAGFGFGEAATPAGRKAFADHDVMLAIGTRFAEIATGSYSIPTPRALIHVDIDPAVPGANYPTAQAITADATEFVTALVEALPQRPARRELMTQIAKDKADYRERFANAGNSKLVNPANFFSALRKQYPDDTILAMDDGNHTFLVAELWQSNAGGMVISPTDFNAMGYAVPAAVAAKLANPKRDVACVVGDGCIRMTGLELTTASALRLGLVVYVFNDGELSQISQAQALPYNRKTCSVLPNNFQLEGLAHATGAHYLALGARDDLNAVIGKARTLARQGVPVLVDVRVDYSQQTAFTKGIIKTNFRRFPTRDKVRIVGRAMKRKMTR